MGIGFPKTTNVKNGGASASKIEPGTSLSGLFERKFCQLEEQSTLKAPLGPPKNFKSARTSALRASKSVCERPRRARPPNAPRRFSVFSRWISLIFFEQFETLSDAFKLFQTCLDNVMFTCVWIHSDSLGCIRIRLYMFQLRFCDPDLFS